MVAATLVKAGSHRVVPLEVEEVRHHAGQDTQDGEINAATRLLDRVRQDHPRMPLVVLGVDRYGPEPFLGQLCDERLHPVLVWKPMSHPERYTWVEGIEVLGGG